MSSELPSGTPRTAPTLVEMLRRAAARFGDRPAYAIRRSREQWDPRSFHALHEDALALATALIDLGLEPQQTVGLLSESAYEWLVASFGIAFAGGLDVPRAVETPDDSLIAILTHAEVELCFAQTTALAQRLERLAAALPRLRQVIVMESAPPPRLDLASLLGRGRALRANGDRRAEARAARVQPSDLATLIYTSGTTGRPKGVELTHANLTSQLRSLPVEIGPDDRLLSILPVWHAYERIFLLVSISHGACTYASSVRTVSDDLTVVRPTFLASAPRLWESIHARIQKKLASAPGLRRRLFALAYGVARRAYSSREFLRGRHLDLEARGRVHPALLGTGHAVRLALLALPWWILDRLILRKVRAILGGRFRGTVSGGGALPRHVDVFFNTVGIPVLEGYGLTETSPVLAVRTFDQLVIGTVGPIFPGTELRIVEPGGDSVLYPDPEHPRGGRSRVGEIVVKGPQVMRGYRNDPEATRAVLRDGWLRTGDLGLVTGDGSLRIVGRLKDTIVLRNGESVEPSPIEAVLSASPLIDQCILVGQDQRFVAALVVGSLEEFAARGIAADSHAALAADRAAARLIEEELTRIFSGHSGFLAHERPRTARLLPAAFSVGAELTPTFKLRRSVIAELYRDLVSGIYERDPIG